MITGILHIHKPFLVQAGHVKSVDGCFDGYLTVSGVTKSFPVGTIAADTAVEVSKLGPEEILEYFVEKRIGTLKIACLGHIRVYNFHQ